MPCLLSILDQHPRYVALPINFNQRHPCQCASITTIIIRIPHPQPLMTMQYQLSTSWIELLLLLLFLHVDNNRGIEILYFNQFCIEWRRLLITTSTHIH